MNRGMLEESQPLVEQVVVNHGRNIHIFSWVFFTFCYLFGLWRCAEFVEYHIYSFSDISFLLIEFENETV